jgi:hypothetical protein
MLIDADNGSEVACKIYLHDFFLFSGSCNRQIRQCGNQVKHLHLYPSGYRYLKNQCILMTTEEELFFIIYIK